MSHPNLFLMRGGDNGSVPFLCHLWHSELCHCYYFSREGELNKEASTFTIPTSITRLRSIILATPYPSTIRLTTAISSPKPSMLSLVPLESEDSLSKSHLAPVGGGRDCQLVNEMCIQPSDLAGLDSVVRGIGALGCGYFHRDL